MRLALGARQHAHVAKLEMLALEAEAFAGPCLAQNLDRFERAAKAMLFRDLQAVELFIAVAHPYSQAQSAVGNDIDHSGIFGQAQRMIKRREQNVGSERDPRGARRYRREHCHHRGQVAVVNEVMLGHPERIEAGLLEEFDLPKHRGIESSEIHVRRFGISEIEHVTKFHLRHIRVSPSRLLRGCNRLIENEKEHTISEDLAGNGANRPQKEQHYGTQRAQPSEG